MGPVWKDSSSWEVFLLNPRTGVVGARLDVTGGTWADGPINEIPQLTATVDKTPFVGSVSIPAADWAPWASGLLACWDGIPVVAGPITSWPKETSTTLTFTAAGIEKLLERWLVLADNYPTGDDLRRAGPVTFTAGSLATIGWRLVDQAMRRCGQLPIVRGVILEEGTAHTRTYPAWNLANNGLHKRLQELAGVIGGPDIAFRPRWRLEGRQIEWVMVAGTKAQPEIPQTHTPVLDLTSQAHTVTAFDPAVDWDPVSRVYAVGAGQEAGQLVSMAYARDDVRYRIPVIESVLSDTGTDVWPLLQSHADAQAAARSRLIRQLTVTVDGSDLSAGITRWWAGDAAQVTVGDDWASVPAGTRTWRAISRHGDLMGQLMVVELQDEGQ